MYYSLFVYFRLYFQIGFHHWVAYDKTLFLFRKSSIFMQNCVKIPYSLRLFYRCVLQNLWWRMFYRDFLKVEMDTTSTVPYPFPTIGKISWGKILETHFFVNSSEALASAAQTLKQEKDDIIKKLFLLATMGELCSPIVITLELNIAVLWFDEFPSANHQHRTLYILCRNCRKVGLVLIAKKEKISPEKKGDKITNS